MHLSEDDQLKLSLWVINWYIIKINYEDLIISINFNINKKIGIIEKAQVKIL